MSAEPDTMNATSARHRQANPAIARMRREGRTRRPPTLVIVLPASHGLWA